MQDQFDGLDAFQPVEPSLLYATFSTRGRPVFRNPAWEAIFGAEPDPWARLSDDDRLLAGQYLKEAVGGSLVTNEIIPVNTSFRDEPMPVLLNFFPVQNPEAPKRTIAVTVTGEVLAEPTSWTASQTQRHRLESLGRMTMGIVHDVNNLLSTVIGYTELMKSEKADINRPGYFDEHIRMIEQAAVDGAGLVARIQQYIRQEKHTRFEPIDLNTLLNDCISLTRPYWFNEPRRQGIAIQTVVEEQPIPPIMGSATELREVFVNLILNAVQAMPRGGSIRLRTSYDKAKGVVVQVSDTGTGMSERVMRRIFEPLFTTKGEHGTGMGLAVSYGIIQEHEGRITVDSKPGKGTTFELVFPAVATTVSDEPVATCRSVEKKARILVVDDDAKVRSVLVKLLNLKGHVVDEVASGMEALDVLTAKTFDIVFTDHGMPEMNGRRLAAEIRTRFPELPIVLVTGDTEIHEDDPNIDHTIAKPFKLDTLQETIQKLVREGISE